MPINFNRLIFEPMVGYFNVLTEGVYLLQNPTPTFMTMVVAVDTDQPVLFYPKASNPLTVYTIDWGDDHTSTVTPEQLAVTPFVTHNYAKTAGVWHHYYQRRVVYIQVGASHSGMAMPGFLMPNQQVNPWLLDLSVSTNGSGVNDLSKCINLRSLNLSVETDTDAAFCSLTGLCEGCAQLTVAQVLTFGWAADANAMFRGCVSLSSMSLPYGINGFVTSAVGMFQGCVSLTSIIFGSTGLSTSLQDASYMFADSGIEVFEWHVVDDIYTDYGILTLPQVWQWVTNTSYMFKNTPVKQVSMPRPDGWRATHVATGMFEGCAQLTTVDFKCTATPVLTFQDAGRMFYGCTALRYVNNFPTTFGITQAANLFTGCTQLGKTFNLTITNDSGHCNLTEAFADCPAMNGLSLTVSIASGMSLLATDLVTNTPGLTALSIVGQGTLLTPVKVDNLPNLTSFLLGSQLVLTREVAGPMVYLNRVSLSAEAWDNLFNGLPTTSGDAYWMDIANSPSVGLATLTLLTTTKGWVYTTYGDNVMWTVPLDWPTQPTPVANQAILMAAMNSGQTVRVGPFIGSSGTITVDWGDGTSTVISADLDTAIATHSYSAPYSTKNGTVSGTPVQFVTITSTVELRMPALANDLVLPQNRWLISLDFNPGTASLPFGPTEQTYGMFRTCQMLKQVRLRGAGTVTTCEGWFKDCISLKSVIIDTWGSVTDVSELCDGATALESISLPSGWSSVTLAVAMFKDCAALVGVTLPSSWGNLTDLSEMFLGTESLVTVSLPSSWGSVTSVYGMFDGSGIQAVTLPTLWGSVTSAYRMFAATARVTQLTLPPSNGTCLVLGSFLEDSAIQSITWGGATQPDWSVTDLTGFAKNTHRLDSGSLPTRLTSNAGTVDLTGYFGGSTLADRMSARVLLTLSGSLTTAAMFGLVSGAFTLALTGTATLDGAPRLPTASRKYLLGLTVDSRFTFTGTNPQIDVNGASMTDSALDALFASLPTVTGTHTIDIRNTPGASTCNTSLATDKGWTLV